MIGKRIRFLMCDNGGEYTSKVFDEYLKSKGIQRQFSVPRTPQQNDVSERMNRTIQEVARAMVHGAGLSEIYWVEAVLTAVIIRNRSPTTAVQHMTPHECFMGRNQMFLTSKSLDVQHICTFQVKKEESGMLSQ